MTSGDLFIIVTVVLSWALAIGAVTVVLQRLLGRTSIVVQILLVVLATIAILVAGMVSAFNAMFISEADLQVMWFILAIASVVATVVAVLLGVGLARNTNRLAGDAARIGRGEPVAPQRKMTSELSALAAELAATSHKLEESRQREQAVEAARRELVAWVSHDLRTPLASMRAMAEALEDGIAEDVSGYHQRIIGQTDQMAVLVNDLLELSKIQAGTLVLDHRPLDLYDVVSDAIADLAPVAAGRAIAINGDAVAPTLVAADGASLSRAIRNVVLNGILYSARGSTVSIAVNSAAGEAVVEVRDGCGGIPAEDLPRMLTAGWQKDAGRTKSRYSGAGVGLSIVHGIVQAHGGTLEVANVGGGCRFRLRIPAGQEGLGPAV
ncbi:HAMP domain-containing sensor histidine kinase [Pseudarthrobacter sp. AL07]|uniref:sensor histidine kinase n=1 Tax=unclassified Pseudarthrobacter TaxID=2647000 RepID=UPI00249CAEEF|nr:MULTISPECIES: HAMP domain-containing sensor histidine kinase [unclassified Pseudarthrobacter]MDI3194992.1 HAMP domain-containing sensor histidine kinase [Pseudarthrobacter sp. AL20]MDI3209136.1 HAMP domain-containing sensor histidine kinase [Pseudarthrobacter sp. AL07]